MLDLVDPSSFREYGDTGKQASSVCTQFLAGQFTVKKIINALIICHILCSGTRAK
jgi:hypothetical protein